ncbi:MAG: bifunctional diaminohydroxyphosphoribosylaminopyrimidine deaminase/5-amino-6-(5-phosphoribosylamino)uracil reductase RibD [Thermodesulfobacteriota bacterium]|nr:bifunctional diaminohydroxyphosphoribosylaminopyrimidine deaminase/5-amino-6-(5-phosphoribosylamino)uracil reductase RibD [Thermodesulfobacteriota bacterium]
MNQDKTLMRQAIDLAKKGLGRTAPNPPVGAMIVRNSQVVGEGFHPKAGLPHAEIYALRQAGEKARGATMYVTLEPCSHFGKTPPCTDAIIRAGIKKVVIGAIDPNPIVAGQGIESLKSHGIEVKLGVASQEAVDLIMWYEKWIKKKQPYVILKVAMTMDGRIATSKGDSKWITSEKSREMVHGLRDKVDAVLVGIGTVLTDDPRLTCRISGGRNPLRIIIDKDFIIPQGARCLGERCLIFTSKDPGIRTDIINTKVVQLPLDPSGRLSWDGILGHLGKLGLHAVMIEGGGRINTSVVVSGKVDKLMVFVAPRLLVGGIPAMDGVSPDAIKDAIPLKIYDMQRLDDDILIEAFI